MNIVEYRHPLTRFPFTLPMPDDANVSALMVDVLDAELTIRAVLDRSIATTTLLPARTFLAVLETDLEDTDTGVWSYRASAIDEYARTWSLFEREDIPS